MSKFSETLQSIVNQDYSTILALSQKLLVDCVEGIGEMIGEEKAVSVVVDFITAAVAVDGTYSAQEQRLMHDLFGEHKDIIEKRLPLFTDAEVRAALDQLVDAFPTNLKSEMCLLATHVLAVDETINADEHKYLIMLMES